MSQQNERNKWELIVEEEAPHMRSVSMVSHAPTTAYQQPQSPFTFKTTGESSSTEFGGKAKQPSLSYSAQLDVKPVTIKLWSVSKLMSVPMYYQLEHTRVTVSSDVSLEELTVRLMDVFHSESIAVVYDDKEAKASAETKDCIKFAVRLWNSSSNQIIVECQRSAGCSYGFCKVAKKVLKAARDGEKSLKPLKKKTMPSAVRDCVPNIPEEIMKESVEDCLRITSDMINGGLLDEQQLAIETLVHVSESYKTQAFCAMLILTNNTLLSALISVIVYSNLDGQVDSFSSDLAKDCYTVMRRHALTVLVNCFTTLDTDKTFGNLVAERSMLIENNFLKTLVLFVAAGATKPHEAADACKCLQLLCLHSRTTKQTVVDFGASIYLKHAQECRHATLHDASTNLLVALSS